MAPHHALPTEGLHRHVDPSEARAIRARKRDHRSHELFSDIALFIVDNRQDDDTTCRVLVVAKELWVTKEGHIGPCLVGLNVAIQIGGVGRRAVFVVPRDCHEFEGGSGGPVKDFYVAILVNLAFRDVLADAALECNLEHFAHGLGTFQKEIGPCGPLG